MKLGLQVADFTWTGGAEAIGPTLIELAGTAEVYGFDAMAVADHVWQNPYMGGVELPQLECFMTLGHLAANTCRVRLLPLVLAASYRPAGIIAKGMTTLDVISGGRAMLGIGAGYYEAEATGLGLPFPPVAERFTLLEETLQVCLQMWEGPHGSEQPFHGMQVRLERALNVPQSLSRPHPPILIGGSGERKTLRLVAQYADACGLYPTPDLPHKLEVLRRHCDDLGRDFAAIEKTCAVHFQIDADGRLQGDLAAQIQGLAQQGIETVFGIVHGPDPVRTVEVVGKEILPMVVDA
jgi:F420-dependent oxidoreductase-like protein